jgi:hypothetical protein
MKIQFQQDKTQPGWKFWLTCNLIHKGDSLAIGHICRNTNVDDEYFASAYNPRVGNERITYRSSRHFRTIDEAKTYLVNIGIGNYLSIEEADKSNNKTIQAESNVDMSEVLEAYESGKSVTIRQRNSRKSDIVELECKANEDYPNHVYRARLSNGFLGTYTCSGFYLQGGVESSFDIVATAIK